MEEVTNPNTETEELSDEAALMKIAQAMKDNAPSPDEKQNVHTFLQSVVTCKDSTKVGNLRCEPKLDELGLSPHTVRGNKELSLISEKIMNNKYFADYFKQEAEDTLATSLSREGFLVRQATTTVKSIADITKRRKINKGMFGSRKIEEQGGDPFAQNRE